MARNTPNPANTRKSTRTPRAARTATPAHVAAPVAPVLSPVAVLSLTWGTAGRPESGRDAIVAAAFDHIVAALAAYKPAPPARAPHGAPARIRAAFESVASDDAAALALARSAAAAGRARTRR
jgi:hypothetical protein